MQRSTREPFVLATLVLLALTIGQVLLPTASFAQTANRRGEATRSIAGISVPYRATRAISESCSAPDTYTTAKNFDPQKAQQTYLLDHMAPSDSGFVFGTNIFLDRAKGTAFTLPNGVTKARLESVNVWFSYKYTGSNWSNQYDIYYTLQVYNGTPETGPTGDPLVSQRHALIDVKADADWQTSSEATAHQLVSPVEVGPTFFVVIDFETYTKADVMRLAIASTEPAGARVPNVWEKYADGKWYNVSDSWYGKDGAPGNNGWNLWMEARLAVATPYTGTPCLQGGLAAADGVEDYDKLGSALDASGDFAIVGSTGMKMAGAPDTEYGYVRFFVRNGNSWSQQVKLAASDQIYGERFGSSVTISGDYAAAGAPNKGVYNVMDGAGQAYTYARTNNGWVEQSILTASDADDEDAFGTAVSMDGDVLVVSADGKNVATAPDAGAAYVFLRTGGPVDPWTEADRLVASDPQADAYFGSALDIAGNYLVVGAPGYDQTNAPGAGVAYVFARNGADWTQVARLTASDPKEYAGFGEAVAIDGDHVFVGAPGAEAVYVFARNGTSWSQVARLTAGDAASRYTVDHFGTSVSVANGRVLIGAPGANLAYLFTAGTSGWTETAKLTSAITTAQLGQTVALGSEYALVADPEFEAGTFDPMQGAVFTYPLSTITGTDDSDATDARTALLSAPYPNPLRNQAAFSLRLDQTQHVTIAVYDLAGRIVTRLHEGILPAGDARTFTFSATGLPSGAYLLRVSGEQFTETRRLIVVR